jgi:hypothetical protein
LTDLLDDILPVERRTHASVYVISVDAPEYMVLEQLAVLMKCTPLEVIPELIRRATPSPNGAAYEVQCFGCGKKFTVKRRPVPGRHQWCGTCRASGEPAAQRSRDYRERRRSQ